MRLTLTFGAALSLAALAACSQSGQDNAANADANAGMTADESVLPIDDNAANADTLGNQLNQLNDSGNGAQNEAEPEANASTTTTNAY